jgi:hypothetical protein
MLNGRCRCVSSYVACSRWLTLKAAVVIWTAQQHERKFVLVVTVQSVIFVSCICMWCHSLSRSRSHATAAGSMSLTETRLMDALDVCVGAELYRGSNA